MPELPEVEVLVRHLEPLLRNQTVRAVHVRRDEPARVAAVARVVRAAVTTFDPNGRHVTDPKRGRGRRHRRARSTEQSEGLTGTGESAQHLRP